MELKAVLGQVPGLNKRFVYYLEARGYIHPVLLPKTRIARRDYTTQDLHTIQEVWRYYHRGYSVQRAYEMATQRERTVAYVTISVPVRRWREVLGLLQRFREVVEASAVYGDSWDIIVKTDTPDEADIYHALVPVLGEAGLPGMPMVLKAREYYRKGDGTMAARDSLLAYILMKVPSKHIEGVVEQLKAFPEVLEASVIYGESDIVAKVAVRSPQELDRLVMERVHGIEPVESTRTFIVVGNLRWSRE